MCETMRKPRVQTEDSPDRERMPGSHCNWDSCISWFT
jgi:hypothetical protein